jgi:hypothetical protein
MFAVLLQGVDKRLDCKCVDVCSAVAGVDKRVTCVTVWMFAVLLQGVDKRLIVHE